MTTSVVIVNYRTAAMAQHAAHSAVDAGANEVVVVDNASGDGSAEQMQADGDARVRVIVNDRNAGFGSAANLGSRHADGDALVFLNSDAALRARALVIMAEAVAEAGGRVIVGPRLVGIDGDIQRSAGLVPQPGDLLIRGLGLHHVLRALRRFPFASRIFARNRVATEYDQAVTAESTIDVSMVSGACMAIGRTAFEELGRFDERYFMYFEDADLCRRASAAGWPIRYVPGAVVDHVGGASSPGDYRFGPMHSASMIRYLRAWHGATGMTTGLAILWFRALGHALTLRPSTGQAVASLRAGLAVAANRA